MREENIQRNSRKRLNALILFMRGSLHRET